MSLRLSLRTKVLIPVAIMILAVMITALFVVNQVVRKQVLAGINHNLKLSGQIFLELQQKESELLTERSVVIAEAPHLKAAVDTGDSTTVQHVTEQMFKNLGSDILLVTNRLNQILAKNGLMPEEMPLHLSEEFNQQTDGSKNTIFATNIKIYRVHCVPIVTGDEIIGAFHLGQVIAGKSIDDKYLQVLQSLVDCDILFRYENMTLSTLTDSAVVEVFKSVFDASRAVGASLIEAGEDEYLVMRVPPDGNFLLIKSVDEAFATMMQPIEKTIAFVGIFALIAAILISTFISHEVVNPVTKLVQATEKISAGDYGHQIDVSSGDEIGRLAGKFNEMREILKQKIAQLNDRNQDLVIALKKLEETQQELVRSERLAATGKITAQLSHELNNPIHNMQGCLEAAQKKFERGESGVEFIDLAYQEVLRLGKLTRQMLDFYRPISGMKSELSLTRVLDEILKSAGMRWQDKKINLVKNYNLKNDRIYAAADQLKQVFLNIILNAIDAMPGGGVLDISAYPANGDICISFKDTGVGISRENLDKIFDAFFTTKNQANGVGLGLSVSYGIIKSHGGDISVESEINNGAKFTIKLPRNLNG